MGKITIDVSRSNLNCPSCKIFMCHYWGKAYCFFCQIILKEPIGDFNDEMKETYPQTQHIYGYCNECGKPTNNALCCSMPCYAKWRVKYPTPRRSQKK